MEPPVLHLLLSWANDRDLFFVEVAFRYTCRLGFIMTKHWPISRILNQPRPSNTLYENSKVSAADIFVKAAEMRARQEKFGTRPWELDEESDNPEESWDLGKLEEPWSLEKQQPPREPWWLGSGEKLAYKSFFETNPHRILDVCLDDLGVREVDAAIKSILPIPDVSEQEEIGRAFEKYIEERDMLIGSTISS